GASRILDSRKARNIPHPFSFARRLVEAKASALRSPAGESPRARFFLARVRFDPNRCGLESSVWIVRRLPRTPRKIRRLSVMTWRENHDEESVRAAGSTSNVERQFGNRRGARHA